MKLLSLKLDDEVFYETEEILKKMQKARNRYINEALHLFNEYNKRKMLKKQLEKESLMVGADSLKLLKEFEKLADAYEKI
jgi:hypothetical protein